MTDSPVAPMTTNDFPKENAPAPASPAPTPAPAPAKQEPQHVYRADMGEGLPDQKDTLNPNRAK